MTVLDLRDSPVGGSPQKAGLSYWYNRMPFLPNILRSLKRNDQRIIMSFIAVLTQNPFEKRSLEAQGKGHI